MISGLPRKTSVTAEEIRVDRLRRLECVHHVGAELVVRHRALFGRDLGVRADMGGIDDGGVEPRLDAVVQEDGVQHATRVRRQPEAHVGDAEDREHVFDRFYRAPEARTMPGSGLGLSIVKQIADLHAGSIELLPRDGGGSIARLTLPA